LNFEFKLGLARIFLGFSSGWVEISQEIDGVAGGFYLGACTQGKEHRHNIRDEVST